MIKKNKIDKVLDMTGLLCPVPTVMTTKTLKDMKKGKILQVITNDITTRQSIPMICDDEGYTLLELTESDGLLAFTVKK